MKSLQIAKIIKDDVKVCNAKFTYFNISGAEQACLKYPTQVPYKCPVCHHYHTKTSDKRNDIFGVGNVARLVTSNTVCKINRMSKDVSMTCAILHINNEYVYVNYKLSSNGQPSIKPGKYEIYKHGSTNVPKLLKQKFNDYMNKV
jgi:hypothetical protein